MPETPATIGRYRIRREVGRGMMGVVYEAVDPESSDRVVALKTIEVGFMLTPAERKVFEQRFLAEARIAARLSHPGIVAVHDVGSDPETGALYIALEFLDGQTLADRLRTGVPLPWREALRIAARVAHALHHAHSHGVIHRDVKPANIMILPSGEPKLMDFGIAKTETARIKLTATGQFFGTPLYMAPEQALARSVDGRADVFSLGAIAYTLLTGHAAFGAENITKIVLRVIHDEPPPPSRAVVGLPEDVDYVIARSLAKDPARRYADAQALAEDVEDVLSGITPRHREGWLPAAAEATLVDADHAELDLDRLLLGAEPPRAPALDLEAQLETLVPSPPREAPLPDRVATRPAPRRSPGAQRGRVIAAGVMGLMLLGAAFLYRQRMQTPVPVARPSASATRAAMPTTTLPPSAPSSPAQLVLEFEHSLKDGTLRVWLDDELVVEQRLAGRVKKLSAFGFRKGERRERMEVVPGTHEIRVQVAWDDKRKTERTSADFKSGATRRLRGRIGGVVFKNLSLKWQ